MSMVAISGEVIGACVSMAVAAERDVDIVAEPGRESDVPAPPEVGKADGRVGKAEIVRESKSQAQGGADRGDGVAGKVAEDLSAEGQGRGPGIDKAWRGFAVVDPLYHWAKESVGEHCFLKQAQGHQGQTRHCSWWGVALWGTSNCGTTFSGAHDCGPATRCGKKVTKKSVVERSCGLAFFFRAGADKCRGVVHGGEGVKTRDADEAADA